MADSKDRKQEFLEDINLLLLDYEDLRENFNQDQHAGWEFFKIQVNKLFDKWVKYD